MLKTLIFTGKTNIAIHGLGEDDIAIQTDFEILAVQFDAVSVAWWVNEVNYMPKHNNVLVEAALDI